jgi:prepilin-type processing-associated H-X9-DG protein/prepilin-type N-terminal cleavage/methylation domain-containing protein
VSQVRTRAPAFHSKLKAAATSLRRLRGSRKENPMKNQAFTLVEVLICIGIIAIVSAILTPVLSSARKNAQKSACMSNENQIQAAIKLYTQDYDGYFPHDLSFRQFSAFKVYKNLQCASKDFQCEKEDEYPCGYGYNVQIVTNGAGPIEESLVHESMIRFPSVFIIVTELNNNFFNVSSSLAYFEALDRRGDKSYERHNGGANYAFADGHVKWLTRGQISANLATDLEKGTMPSFVR